MTKRRGKRTTKQPVASEISLPPSAEQEVERQIAAVKAIDDIEIDHLLTRLRLVRSYFSEDQLQTPVLQIFEENLPNIEIVRNGEDEHIDVRLKDETGNMSTYNPDERDINASLFHHMSIAYPSSSAARQSFGGLQFLAKTIKSDVGVDDFQFGNYMSQESLNTMMLGMPEGLQTPGATSGRLSVGMTPKTKRLPKHGEMLLSVHGSPLGVYKEDEMEPIHESEEGSLS